MYASECVMCASELGTYKNAQESEVSAKSCRNIPRKWVSGQFLAFFFKQMYIGLSLQRPSCR